MTIMHIIQGESSAICPANDDIVRGMLDAADITAATLQTSDAEAQFNLKLWQRDGQLACSQARNDVVLYTFDPDDQAGVSRFSGTSLEYGHSASASMSLSPKILAAQQRLDEGKRTAGSVIDMVGMASEVAATAEQPPEGIGSKGRVYDSLGAEFASNGAFLVPLYAQAVQIAVGGLRSCGPQTYADLEVSLDCESAGVFYSDSSLAEKQGIILYAANEDTGVSGEFILRTRVMRGDNKLFFSECRARVEQPTGFGTTYRYSVRDEKMRVLANDWHPDNNLPIATRESAASAEDMLAMARRVARIAVQKQVRENDA
jgi:hypothetical protein